MILYNIIFNITYTIISNITYNSTIAIYIYPLECQAGHYAATRPLVIYPSSGRARTGRNCWGACLGLQEKKLSMGRDFWPFLVIFFLKIVLLALETSKTMVLELILALVPQKQMKNVVRALKRALKICRSRTKMRP